MPSQNRFHIRNDLSRPVILNIEPEGIFYPLPGGEAVSVTEEFTTEPVTIELTGSDEGNPIISIWPGDGEVRVERDGVDVLDAGVSQEEETGEARREPPLRAINPGSGPCR